MNPRAHRLALFAFVAAATGCTGVTHSLRIVEPLPEAIESGATLGVSLAGEDPDFDPGAMAALEGELIPALQGAGVFASVLKGASDTTYLLKLTVAEYESTSKFGRAMGGIMAGPAILVGSLELSRQGGNLISTAVTSANSSGFGIFAGTDVETHQKTVENTVSFLKQSAPATAARPKAEPPPPEPVREREPEREPERVREEDPKRERLSERDQERARKRAEMERENERVREERRLAVILADQERERERLRDRPAEPPAEPPPAVAPDAKPCYICAEPRGDVTPCPSCGMD